MKVISAYMMNGKLIAHMDDGHLYIWNGIMWLWLREPNASERAREEE